MMVLSMDSKRQRRPSVRLGEVGDVPAASVCGFTQKSHGTLGSKSYKPDAVNFSNSHLLGVDDFCLNQNIIDLVRGPGISLSAPTDLLQNRENKNPNSSKTTCEFVGTDENHMVKCKYNFGTATLKGRITKRRGRRREGNNTVLGSAWTWSSKVNSQLCGEKETFGVTSNDYADHYFFDGLKDFADCESPATSKEAVEYNTDETADAAWQKGNTNYYGKEGDFYERNDMFQKSGDGWDELRCESSDVNSVGRWLKDVGFGKYAGLFEIHEVNEETLPFLTLEDLKEMGVFAIGHRRKLYNAIQQLGGDNST